MNILIAKNIHISYKTKNGEFTAVNGPDITVRKNEILGIAGESGSGKSTMCLGLLRLLQDNAKFSAKMVEFNGADILSMKESQFRSLRWKQLSYIPQAAMNTLNPVRRIRRQFYDTMIDHGFENSKENMDRHIENSLQGVNLPPDTADKFAHELSGGMKQRICIALATLLNPKLIIADEPTSALDVISQRLILEIITETRKRLGASMIIIGHDMALQAQMADRLAIMYAGYFVEIGPVHDIFNNPLHPYTKQLIKAIPSIKKKENIRVMAEWELSPGDREKFKIPRPLKNVTEDHLVADFN
jgi:ABC-type dipeptide/oligopeptide/nickel transport system ATPase component